MYIFKIYLPSRTPKRQTVVGNRVYISTYQNTNVIDTLVTRALKLSDDDNINDELEYVTEILKGNNYPINTIKSRIEYLQSKMYAPQPYKDKEKKWIPLPYTGSICKRLSRLLRNKMNTNIGYYAGRKLSTLLYNFKDKRTPINCGIYELKCKPPCSMPYVGESERDIETRLKEHDSHTRHNRVQLSAIAKHMADNPGHELDKSSLRLLERETRYFARKFKEALFIKKANITMNANEGKKINPIWEPTLLPLIKFP